MDTDHYYGNARESSGLGDPLAAVIGTAIAWAGAAIYFLLAKEPVFRLLVLFVVGVVLAAAVGFEMPREVFNWTCLALAAVGSLSLVLKLLKAAYSKVLRAFERH